MLRNPLAAMLFQKVVSGSVAFDEFVEAALLALGGFLLAEKGEVRLLENPEELVPADFGQILVLFPEVHAQNAALALRGDLGGRPLRASIQALIFS